MREKYLIMGPPGAGKTYTLINVYQALLDLGIPMHIIDMEDKIEAFVSGMNLELPKSFHVALSWEEFKEAVGSVCKVAKPNEWIAVDRVDLAWPMVQRWYTQQKYNESLADKMLETAKGMKKASMVMPRFDQGSWQVINEQYDSTFNQLFYLSRCHILLTTGIKREEDNPLDVLGNIGVTPRGQKELPHQPNAVFLVHQKKVGKEIRWLITTGKDLIGRDYFDAEEITDFSIQYVDKYWKR